MATTIPNWADLDALKSQMYLDLKDTDAARDEALEMLGQYTTDKMIHFPLNMVTVDQDAPSLALKQACLKQCTYEWRQRKTPGLSSVQMQDGSINKHDLKDGWLEDVYDTLIKFRSFVLYETI